MSGTADSAGPAAHLSSFGQQQHRAYIRIDPFQSAYNSGTFTSHADKTVPARIERTKTETQRSSRTNFLKKDFAIVASQKTVLDKRILDPRQPGCLLLGKTLGFPSHPYGWFGFLQV